MLSCCRTTELSANNVYTETALPFPVLRQCIYWNWFTFSSFATTMYILKLLYLSSFATTMYILKLLYISSFAKTMYILKLLYVFQFCDNNVYIETALCFPVLRQQCIYWNCFTFSSFATTMYILKLLYVFQFCDNNVCIETALLFQFCDKNVYIETALLFPVLRQQCIYWNCFTFSSFATTMYILKLLYSFQLCDNNVCKCEHEQWMLPFNIISFTRQ